MLSSSGYTATNQQTRPGDRVVVATDGMLERNATLLGLPALLLRTRALHPKEASRTLADMALYSVGHQLADDATLLVLNMKAAPKGTGTLAVLERCHRTSGGETT